MAWINTLYTFLIYFISAVALFSSFVVLYLRLTPYAEIHLIRNGNTAAAISLIGAMLGFALPVANVIAHSTSLLDMVIWSTVALLVQASVYWIVSRLIPEFKQQIEKGNTAHASLLAGLSVVAGILNAACVTY